MRLFSSILSIMIMLAIVSYSPAHTAPDNRPVAEKKETLVMMPLKVESVDRGMLAAMETAIVEWLQDRYVVYAGENVVTEGRKIFARESRAIKKD